MEAAIKSVLDGTLSANKAADIHGIPRTTLKDRLSGRVEHGTNPGPKPYLTAEEESELCSHLLQASELGLGKTRRDVMCLVEGYVKKKGTMKASSISNGWWDKFLKRNPQLSLRSGDSTAGVRMDAMNAKNIDAYFDLLKSVYDENEFESHPEAIYNMDETGVPLEPRPPKVLAKRGQKKVRCRTSGQKAQITVIGCGSATGQILPPFIIYAAKQLNYLWTHDEVSGTRYGVSDKGWVDQGLFYLWLKDHFLPNAVSRRPLLLLLDGHSSHFEPQSIQFAKDNEIIIFCLPPHTTHECQPLDVGLFGPLKKHWQRECHRFYQSTPYRVISKLNFNSVFRTAWLNSVSPSNICSGFKKSGVFPFNRAAVTVSRRVGELGGDGVAGRGESSFSGEGSGESSGEGHDESGGEGHGESGQEEHSEIGREGPGESGREGPGESSGEGPGESGGEGHSESSREGPGESGGEGHGESGGNVTNHLGGCQDEIAFTIEELRFSVWLEEGYDLYDPRYDCWLKRNHPELAKQSQSPLGHSTSATTNSSVTSLSTSPVTLTTSSQSLSSTPLSLSTSKRSPLSELFKFPENVGSTKSSPPNTGRARVLTSAECLQVLKEKEEKKKQIQLEKENRKVEREAKRKEREEEKKRKAEEKVRKAAEREVAKTLKEKARLKKSEDRSIKSMCDAPSTSSGTKRSSSRQRCPTHKKAKLDDVTVGMNRDTDMCCVCLGSYVEDIDTGREWVQCSCLKWLHEDCIDSEDVDSSSGRLCPLC